MHTWGRGSERCGPPSWVVKGCRRARYCLHVSCTARLGGSRPHADNIKTRLPPMRDGSARILHQLIQTNTLQNTRGAEYAEIRAYHQGRQAVDSLRQQLQQNKFSHTSNSNLIYRAWICFRGCYLVEYDEIDGNLAARGAYTLMLTPC